MDELILLGLLILAAVIASPIMALIALSRSRRLERELTALKQQIATLQKQPGAPLQNVPTTPTVAPPPGMTAAADAVTRMHISEPLSAAAVSEQPVSRAVSSGEPAAPVTTQHLAQSNPAPDVKLTVPKSKQPLPAVTLFSGLISWFLNGNPLAKLGVILLFFGVGYLLKYSIERDIFPPELRLASAALMAIVLLGIGWRLRHKQALYGLILQGGAVGALYLTVFGAFRLYDLLPQLFAFGLMIAICFASVGLAVLQRSLSLATLASLGGYLSPLLLSTGIANPIGLFSYYLLISCGILAISLWQSWRALNLLGFVFTFGVGALWGLEHYTPDDYLFCQLFLLANLILFSILTGLFATKHRVDNHMAIDGTLLFGPSLVGFAMQYTITEHWPFGPAFSALGFGLLYLLMTWLMLRRFAQQGKRLGVGYLALGAGFVTLAIPLALSAQWTALAWALEGVGILWFGLLQQQRRISLTGSALLLLALGSQTVAYLHYGWGSSLLWVLPVLSVCFITAAGLWRHYQPTNCPWARLSLGLLVSGIAIWCGWLWKLPLYWYRDPFSQQPSLLALLGLSISVWLWHAVGRRLSWRQLQQSVWLLWPGFALTLLMQFATHSHPLFTDGWGLAWLAIVASVVLLLKRVAPTLLLARWEKGAHLLLFWLTLILFGAEIYWRSQQLPWGMDEWRLYILIVSLSLILLLLWLAERGQCWPLTVHAPVYWLGCVPVVLLLLGVLAIGNLHDGQIVSWHYLPLLNPLEQAASFGLVMLYVWQRRFSAQPMRLPAGFGRVVTVLLAALAFWWFNGIVVRALAYYGDIAWWFDRLWASRLIQTTLALVWTLLALIAMVYATRKRQRTLWFTGAALLSVVVIKLFMIDSAQGGGLARAIAFLGVAGLLLAIGYFAPLPPRILNEQRSTK